MKIRRFFIRYCDQLTRVQFWIAIVSAALAGAGSGVLFGAHEAGKVADKRVAEVQTINLSLIQTLQQKITPLVTQQAEVAEQQSALSEKLETATDRMETAATKSTLTATTASKAANQAGQVVRKARAPVSTLRQVPNHPSPVKCWNNKDVFGDPCP
ncbi:hypothetical protein ACYX78_14780 [Advenella incenata]